MNRRIIFPTNLNSIESDHLVAQLGTVEAFECEARGLFFRIFPMLAMAMGDQVENFIAEYFATMPRYSILPQDFWCYFAGFLHLKKKLKVEFIELARWEWTLAWLEIQPEFAFKGDRGQLLRAFRNEVVHLYFDNSYLSKTSGSYLIYFDPHVQQIKEMKLEPLPALIFDVISEDRKYTRKSLREMVELQIVDLKLGISHSVDQKIEEMMEQGLLIELQ